ncbi:SDR family oxidoreductase [Sphingomonas histidinilytica]|uniref:NAD(P)-dependent dehydrogenase, short-chain alcohol dehydrogenase family n=1 Tax=Rhizorhabdus histidinilytica TaxID=439228 RepID=A0A1T5DZZ5_9SPHN|nr:SDR family NAD(P)-dependent oxidoreductase [Rhizorhabdus histidinilytica]MBO9377990.1 SDR family oxidoreductase [Rhizorhabdus histidinilytica]QEH80758.1 SDR family oxidoreductase [Sphingomonas sp. C8-2]SKB77275.1 NAD(P)-dependent dehydrogenase, short-chain alcohol dehydrogenase family [Rhizorhabdus histidinilytica]
MGWSDIDFDYAGARVLVTGGTSGIGAAIAGAYADAGAQVTITGTRGSPADYDEDLSRFDYRQLDVERGEQVDAVAAGVDRLDILVNNAGLALGSLGFDEWDPAVFERSVAMHLTSAFRMAHGCRAALARSERPAGASIIGIASMTSYFGIGMIPGYGSAKTGILGLTRVLAAEWASQRIRVNAVAAGLTRSRMTAGAFEAPEWTAPTLQRTPLGRLGEPKDIAGAVLFLSSSAASWITGQIVPIDGGFTIAG